jgi:hypothetical protein
MRTIDVVNLKPGWNSVLLPDRAWPVAVQCGSLPGTVEMLTMLDDDFPVIQRDFFVMMPGQKVSDELVLDLVGMTKVQTAKGTIEPHIVFEVKQP